MSIFKWRRCLRYLNTDGVFFNAYVNTKTDTVVKQIKKKITKICRDNEKIFRLQLKRLPLFRLFVDKIKLRMSISFQPKTSMTQEDVNCKKKKIKRSTSSSNKNRLESIFAI